MISIAHIHNGSEILPEHSFTERLQAPLMLFLSYFTIWICLPLHRPLCALPNSTPRETLTDPPLQQKQLAHWSPIPVPFRLPHSFFFKLGEMLLDKAHLFLIIIVHLGDKMFWH